MAPCATPAACGLPDRPQTGPLAAERTTDLVGFEEVPCASGRAVKIAFVLGQFPSLSETFVLNQITGLIDRGQQVSIFAERAPADPETHPDVERYGLTHL